MFGSGDYKKKLRKGLPAVRGRILEDIPFSKLTWLGVGGTADFVFDPKDKDDISHFLQNLKGVPLILLGGCSNVLIRDGGILGCVVRLGKAFAEVRVEGSRIYCGAGAKNVAVAKAAMEHGVGGLEFLYDIPGTIGGALRMNAGSQGREMKDVVTEVGVLDGWGRYFDVGNAEMMFSYRESNTPSDWLFTAAVLEGHPEDSAKIKETIDEYRRRRLQVQPMGLKTAGSAFKNPPGITAWKLIDNSGCRGLKVGGAMISEKHCNFIINTGGATAADVENLGETVQERVLRDHGIFLEWEIRRIGVKERKK